MSVLVMDGVRRSRQGGSTLVLRSATETAAAELVLPQTPTWTGGGAFDSLSRVAQNIASPSLDSVAEAIPDARQRSGLSPWAITGLITIPMVAAGSILGVRTALANRDSHSAAKAKPITQAPAVPSTEQAKLSPDSQATAAVSSTSLQQLLDNFGLSSTYSLYVKDLKSGQLAVVGPDRVFESASLYKLYVADGIYHAIDTGQLSYSNQAGGGTGNTIGGCLNLMITISDNGCGQALGGLLGWSSLTQTMQAQGYDATNLTGEYTYTSPRNVATLYERLYAGTLLSPDSTNQFMSLLKAQKVNNRLPQGLPAGTTFAHKTGDLDGYMHDAGIVFGPKTDYLVVMMGAPGAQPNDFATLSQRLYSYFNQ